MTMCERSGRPHDDSAGDVECGEPVNVNNALAAFGADGLCPCCFAAFLGEWAAYPPQMLCLGHVEPPPATPKIGAHGWWRVWTQDPDWKSATCRDPALADI
jgi:hypothetical protein